MTDLQDTYGRWAWRWRAPRRARAPYKLGELTPTHTAPTLTSSTDSGQPPPPTPADTSTPATSDEPRTTGTNGRGRSAPRRRTRGKTRKRTARRTVPDVADLMPLGWRIAADLERRGQPLTRDALAAGLHEADQTASNARLGALLNRLKAETPAVLGDTDTSTSVNGDQQ